MAKKSSSGVETARIRNFAGGLNIRDAQQELALSESPDNWNVTLDERGGVQSRLGMIKYNSSAFNASLVVALYYWPSSAHVVTQSGTKLYLDTGATEFKTFTTSAPAAFADFNGKLWIVHPVDGLFQSDGTAVGTTAVAAGPTGTTMTVWQSRLVIAGNTTNTTRVYASGIADGTDWLTTAGHGWTNDIKEGSSDPVVALHGAAGIDIVGRPGLLVFKNRSAHRIYDSGTGAYTTIDSLRGAASSRAVGSIGNRTVALGEQGICITDGVGPLIPASNKEEPLWTPDQVAFDKISKWCLGVKGNRVRVSVPRFGSTANDLALEFHPEDGWIVAGSNAASCYALYTNNARKLLAGSPATAGRVYQFDSGGTDDGTAISSWFQTRWFELNDGFLTRLRRLRVIGRGAFQIATRIDYEASDHETLSPNLVGTSYVYDSASSKYDDVATYGSAIIEAFEDFYSPGTCKAISFRVSATTSTSDFAQPLLGAGNGVEVGAWALYGVDVNHIQLGLA